MLLQIQHCQERIRVRLIAVDLHRRPEHRLGQDELREGREIEQLGIGLQELTQEDFDAVEVGCGLRVKPLELDVYHVRVLQSHTHSC